MKVIPPSQPTISSTCLYDPSDASLRHVRIQPAGASTSISSTTVFPQWQQPRIVLAISLVSARQIEVSGSENSTRLFERMLAVNTPRAITASKLGSDDLKEEPTVFEHQYPPLECAQNVSSSSHVGRSGAMYTYGVGAATRLAFEMSVLLDVRFIM
eukprot:CAMPEP_0183343080 /NCGR_PEP_ID=MMETSP0164_2-20130417/9060_1 /TAXON_ID=221442 /ORGANISM="Coccolithus pelagicus ssp braarudi, Strain PLY182g" /LENGTH=155 /DNA_ID=CAMNT_0025513829 /DNA_START=412 /DNA_END=876 /DNA_ORIENTATION=+